MRSVMEVEETDTEVTLGMKSLLGIFFGLVLVCGIFFGFGYSMGRRSPNATALATAPAPTASTSNDVADAGVRVPKPSADFEGSDSVKNAAAPATGEAESEARRVVVKNAEPGLVAAQSETPRQVPASRSQKPAASTAAAPPAATAPPAPRQVATGAATSSGAIMVQIAAVAHREDADVLAAALHKRGYTVTIRNEARDSLLHVQVGPFASRADAAGMKQRLLADGYNAIVKP